ncbi:YcaO-like family protein [Lacrimispora amygdalina]|uniref:YcaO-like family protein n=1 Tax=Lacrimispora amygdalina TaxID=253257 RepID=UPI0014072450|nr:YcaO-like family protein [Lacrimispora amygdalina]
MRYQSRKDCLPEQTIQKIREILYSAGLFPYEMDWTMHVKNCHALRLGLDGFPGKGVNGKGVTKSYALASAYGEMMERIQCGMMFKRQYGLMSETFLKYPGAKAVDANKLISNYGDILSTMLKVKIYELEHVFSGLELSCFPYYHVNSESVVYLPESLINMTIGSNGMCAGNNASEAIVQGLSEIMERYVSKKMIDDHYEFPDIPVKDIDNSILIEMIKDVENKGYKLIIKDFTLGGKFPCLGVILMDCRNMKYTISLGAHPVFDIALQRCITEVFQTSKIQHKMLSFLSLFDSRSKLNADESKDSLDINQSIIGAYVGNLSIFETNCESDLYKNAFLKNPESNDISLKFMLNRLKEMGFEIFIRDASYLGFPAYRIYVNGMSEMYQQSLEELKDAFHSEKSLKRYMLRIKQLSKEELGELAERIEDMSADSGFLAQDLYNACQVIFEQGSDFQYLLNEFDYFMTLLYCSIGNYTKAYFHLKKYIDIRGDRIQNITYFTCVLHYLKLHNEGKQKNLNEILIPIYGQTAKKVIEDMSEPEKIFEVYDLPNCGDCSICSYNGKCSYLSWTQYTQKMQDKIDSFPFGEERLSAFLQKI